MPAPTPTAGESREHFLGRCIPFWVDEGKPRSQASAICYTAWRDKKEVNNMEDKLYGLTEIKAAKDEERVVEFVATSEIVDYDGDIVKVDGMDISKIKKTKSFLWSHRQADLPIGQIMSLKKDGKQIVGKAKMTSEEEYPFGYTIYKLIKGGYINNVSISFIPDYASIEYKEKNGKQIRIINKATMLEISAVNIGANQNALMSAKSLKDTFEKAWDDEVIDGLELNKLNEYLEKEEEDQSLEDIAKTLEQKLIEAEAKIAELELQLKEQEAKEETQDDIYSILYNEFMPSSDQQGQPIDEPNESLTIDDIDNIL